MNDLTNYAQHNLKTKLQSFLSRRSVQIALLILFGLGTLAIALFDRYIEPYALAEAVTEDALEERADANEDAQKELAEAASEDERSAESSARTVRETTEDTVGGVASRDVFVTHTFPYVSLRDDDIITQRKLARDQARPVWRYDETINLETFKKISRTFEYARQNVCRSVLISALPEENDGEEIDALENDDEPSANDDTQRVADDVANEQEKEVYRQCLSRGLKPDSLSEKQREQLVCNEPLRARMERELGVNELRQEHCDALVQEGLSNERRNALMVYTDDLMAQHIVKNQDALEKLQEALTPRSDSQATGFVLTRSVEANQEELLLDEEDDRVRGAREIRHSIDGFYTLDAAIKNARQAIESARESDNAPDIVDEATHAIAMQLLVPNTFFDEETTTREKQAAAARLYNRFKTDTFVRGQRLLSEGETITEEHAKIIDQMNLTAPRIPNLYWEAFGLGLLLFITAFSVSAAASERKHVWPTRDITMMGLVLLLQIALIRVGFNLSNQTLIEKESSTYAIAILTLLPYGAGSLAVKSLTSSRNAYAFTAISSVLVAAISGYDLTWFCASLAAGIVGAATLQATEKRSSVVRAAAFSSLASFITVVALIAVGHLSDGGTSLLGITAAAGAGFLGTALLSLSLPTLLEFTFRYTTRSTLLELLNDEHPLRAKLHNAPGTLAHSLAVAEYAAKASQEIGANALLTRVGCTFHDIGKLRAPGYFGENNPVHNPHDECDARESAQRIIDHVRHGVEDAKKYGLPKEIIDFIQTHHGTMLVQHFYNVTCNEEGIDNVDPNDFRYPGPLPQSKETGICLIADGIEAMVRAMPDKSAENIERVVHKKIESVRTQGQLIDTGLTAHELDIIEKSLVRQLVSDYHKRPTYAQAPKAQSATKETNA